MRGCEGRGEEKGRDRGRNGEKCEGEVGKRKDEVRREKGEEWEKEWK